MYDQEGKVNAFSTNENKNEKYRYDELLYHTYIFFNLVTV